MYFAIYGHEWCFSSFQNCTSRRRVQFENFKNITTDHIARNARAIIRFFTYNILNKIIKEKKKATITLLWTRNSAMASKLLICSIWAANSTTATKKTSLKLFRNKSFYSNWKLRKLRKSAIQKFRIALYNVFMLSPLANQKRDILLSIL